MRMSGLPFARPTTAAIASLALVTGLVSIAPGVTAASVATRSAAEPAIDQCFNYSAKATKDQAATTPAVDCLTPHTAQTFLTRVLPE